MEPILTFIGLVIFMLTFPSFFLYMNSHVIINELESQAMYERADSIQLFFEKTSWYLPTALAVLGMILMFLA